MSITWTLLLVIGLNTADTVKRIEATGLKSQEECLSKGMEKLLELRDENITAVCIPVAGVKA